MARPSKRLLHELRQIKITRNYIKHAEGSTLIEFGDTKVVCTASIVYSVPKFLKDSGKGWLTAEYGMLPRATQVRTDREAARGRQGGRTLEIQRLIGRSLRSAVDLNVIGEKTIAIDCDVLQADGGTRTAAITGSSIALYDALKVLQERDNLSASPFKQLVAAVSVGIFDGELVLDLDYAEDVKAATDMNVVMTEDGNFVEVQGTAERGTFTQVELNGLLDLAKRGIAELFLKQRATITSS